MVRYVRLARVSVFEQLAEIFALYLGVSPYGNPNASVRALPERILRRHVGAPMKFNPRFATFRARIVTLAILFAVYGAVVLLSGRDGLHAIVVAGILSVLAAVPESPAKAKFETYHITQ